MAFFFFRGPPLLIFVQLENPRYWKMPSIKKERFCLSTSADPLLLSDPIDQPTTSFRDASGSGKSNGASKRHDLINAFVALTAKADHRKTELQLGGPWKKQNH